MFPCMSRYFASTCIKVKVSNSKRGTLEAQLCLSSHFHPTPPHPTPRNWKQVGEPVVGLVLLTEASSTLLEFYYRMCILSQHACVCYIFASVQKGSKLSSLFDTWQPCYQCDWSSPILLPYFSVFDTLFSNCTSFKADLLYICTSFMTCSCILCSHISIAYSCSFLI